MDQDFEKVLKTIKSCKNYQHVICCEKLLELFYEKYINKEETNDVDLSLTYEFLKNQLNLKFEKYKIID